MILFFGDSKSKVFAVETSVKLSTKNLKKISWALNSTFINKNRIEEKFIGPKSSMISPWSTNAIEITKNMGVESLIRIEVFNNVKINRYFDRMIHQKYNELNQKVFTNILNAEKQLIIDNIKTYNDEQGLALDEFEISYLENLSKKIGRSLTDSEVYGFSQVNSEHCRHKIFNGKFIINGIEKEASLFFLIKNTSSSP